LVEIYEQRDLIQCPQQSSLKHLTPYGERKEEEKDDRSDLDDSGCYQTLV